MCGTQVLSQKSSSPSFSFGSSPARINLAGHKSSRPIVLQASVSESMITPGPIYNPTVTSKWLGDGPHASFGKQKQRPSASTLSSDISSFTGKSNLPGPGTYGAQSSIGSQTLTRCASHAAYTFGNAKQHEPLTRTLSPGPIYQVPAAVTKGGRREFPAYSFGGEIRCGSSAGMSTPGPGAYLSKSSIGSQVRPRTRARTGGGGGTGRLVGKTGGRWCVAVVAESGGGGEVAAAGRRGGQRERRQCRGCGQRCPPQGATVRAAHACGLPPPCPQGDSTYRTGPQRVFGSSVDRSVKTSKASPGPIYTGDANACARQKISDKRSAPVIAFPRAQRFQQQGDRRDDYARSTPGPGDYLI